MAIRFDHNNNNSEWMEEMQMLFEKINNRSPFWVIAFIGLILSHFKNVMRSGYLSSEPTKQDQIRSFLINKCEFIGFVEIIIGPSESLFFVYENEPSTTFNLKNYLLVLATTHCNPTAICYCENKQDTQNTDTKEIKFLRIRTHFFGKEFGSTKVKIGISNPKTFIQSLLKLGSFLHGKTIKFLDNPINYPPVILAPWSTPTIPMKTTVEIEEHRKNTTDENLKDLKKLLLQDQINLSIIIVNAINQAENVNGINLTSAIIDKIEYHFRDNTFYFIFNVSNNFLGGKSRLTIEVPRIYLT